ncbi:MAG: hypothetical protein M3041_04545 [Acidobacteriota bacterium]|nr:hypothetical protein [Acidobacteriota bacterium]
MTATPASVTGFPGQTTAPIRVDLTFTSTNGGTGTIQDAGTPAGTTTVPAPITYTTTVGTTTSSTSFQFAIGAATLPGTYIITLRDLTNAAGATNVTLIVSNPSIKPSASPNPVTLVIGGGSQPVTVSTNPDPGFRASPITYAFSGFPAFINPGPAQATTAPGYPPVTFNFSLGAGAVAGTYTGTLTGTYTDPAGAPQSVSVPFTVIVQQPDISASFANPMVNVCEGGAAVSDSINLAPVNGYTGTPRLAFTAPPGIIVTPTSPPANAMPPSQSVPFTVRASGATAGMQTVTLTVSDPAANINKSITLIVNVTAPDFTPSVAPTTLNLVAGGGSQAMTASITPNACFTAGSVTVTPSGQPAGIIFTPPNATITGPSYSPVNFFVQATTAAPGTYPVTFTFTPSNGPARTVATTITVAAGPDFRLTVTPSTVSVAPGQTTQVTVSATGINGFTGMINVTSPMDPNLTFQPATFVLAAGGSQVVNITASPTAMPATFTGQFVATAPGVPGNRTASVTVNVTPGPDFQLSVMPSAVTVGQGQTATVIVSVIGINGFTGNVTVNSPMNPDFGFNPQTFTIPAGGSQMVQITPATTAPLGTFMGAFTGTAPGVSGSRTAPITVNVTAAPDFTLAVQPPTITIAQTGTANVSVSATGINGFTGPVTVTAMPSAGVVVNPPTFVLTPGMPVTVAVTVTSTAPIGNASVIFSGISGSIGPRTATLSITVGGRPDFALTVTPPSISIPANGSGTVAVGVVASNGFSGPVSITANPPAGVTVTPSTFTVVPGATQIVRINVAAGTMSPVSIRFTGNAMGLAHSTDLLINVLAPRPVILNIAPPSVATGSRSIVLRLTGEFFQPGATVSVANGGVHVESVSVISSQIADVTLSVRDDAAAGATTLTLRNPDGGTASGILLVYPFSSIAAPLGVTNAAIVFPPAGTMIANEQKVYPRGLLATTGTGTIIGTWKFDGTPFDRFVVTAGGGFPAEVRAHLAIPISYAGSHRLELEVESPQHAVSPAVDILMAAASVSRLTLLAPRDGAVIVGQGAKFRWSLVPHANGYEVFVFPGSYAHRLADQSQMRIRTTDAEWTLSAQDVQTLGAGMHFWRVRPVFAGETEGEPTETQRFAILPMNVTLSVDPPIIDASRRMHVRWRGGVAGLLYRVDFIGANGQTIFSALTSANEYVVPVSIPAGASVRVTAIGPGGAMLGTSQSLKVSRLGGSEIYLAQQPAVITSQEPQNGAKVSTTQPRIAVNWRGSVRPEDVSLMVDQTDVTAVSTITASSIAYDSLLPLTIGSHTARVSLAGQLTTWTFDIVEGAPAMPQAPSTAGKPASTLQKDWAVTPIGTLTVISGNNADEKDDARLQMSSQTDLANTTGTAKVTADVSMKHALNAPRETIQESRNWITQFLGHHGNYKEEAKIGYAAPSFTDQMELLTTGLARGGVEGRVHFPFAIASGYETFGTRPAGVVAGNFGPEQKIRAASLQTPANEKWDFRVIGFRVTDEPGVNSAGGRGKGVGIFGKYIVNPMLTVLLESARGSFDPNAESAEHRREGSAYRLGFNGVAGTLSYDLSLRRTAADFVNPANRGFTPGGVPDRTGGNLSVTKVIKTTSISVLVRTLRDGNSSGAILPRNRENGGTISVATSIGPRTTLSLGTNWTMDHGAGNPNLSLPNLDRKQTGANGTLAETIGRFNLSQTLTVQRLRDRVNPISDQSTTAGTVSFGGAMTPIINMAAVLSGTRSAGSAAVGTTNQYLASLQPTLTLPRGITFQPRAMYSSSKSDLTNIESRSEQYAGLVTWAPPWHQSALSLQISADTSRNRSTGQVIPSKFVHRYVSTLSLRWGAGQGAAMNGTTVVSAPVENANPQTNDPTTTSTVSH